MVAKPFDRRPFVATGVVLAVALVANAAMRNGLWMGYTVFGIGIFTLFTLLVHRYGLPVPPKSVWIAGLAAALHYLGGALSGLHLGANGLYYAFPWWDNLVHVLGSLAMGVMAYAVLRPRMMAPPVAAGVVATCVAMTGGALVELYEFAQFTFFGTIDQGFYTNTMVDVYNNLIGSALGAYVGYRITAGDAGRADAQAPSADAA